MSQRLMVALLVGVLVACLLWGYSYDRRLALTAAAIGAEKEWRQADREALRRELDALRAEQAAAELRRHELIEHLEATRVYAVDLYRRMVAAGMSAPPPPWLDRRTDAQAP